MVMDRPRSPGWGSIGGQLHVRFCSSNKNVRIPGAVHDTVRLAEYDHKPRLWLETGRQRLGTAAVARYMLAASEVMPKHDAAHYTTQ
jgi:hypothetical protein